MDPFRWLNWWTAEGATLGMPLREVPFIEKSVAEGYSPRSEWTLSAVEGRLSEKSCN